MKSVVLRVDFPRSQLDCSILSRGFFFFSNRPSLKIGGGGLKRLHASVGAWEVVSSLLQFRLPPAIATPPASPGWTSFQ